MYEWNKTNSNQGYSAQSLPIIYEATGDAEDVDGQDYKKITGKNAVIDGTVVGDEFTVYVMAD